MVLIAFSFFVIGILKAQILIIDKINYNMLISSTFFLRKFNVQKQTIIALPTYFGVFLQRNKKISWIWSIRAKAHFCAHLYIMSSPFNLINIVLRNVAHTFVHFWRSVRISRNFVFKLWVLQIIFEATRNFVGYKLFEKSQVKDSNARRTHV